MKLQKQFVKFINNIKLSDQQRGEYAGGYSTLKEQIESEESLKSLIVSVFLHGSSRRGTAIRPKGDEHSDVDVLIVTRLSIKENPEPQRAMDIFKPFLEKHYNGKYKPQRRSFGIQLSYVDLDFVVTSAPSEAEEGILKSAAITTTETVEDNPDWRLVESWVPLNERTPLVTYASKEEEWKTHPLLIPDRNAGVWERTHPIEQIRWTYLKNLRCNNLYINIVKAIKWWQRLHFEDDKPKGYPLEHIVGACCPDSIRSIAEGVTLTFENISNNYSNYGVRKIIPFLPDHGVPENNVLTRVSGDDFAQFCHRAAQAALLSREALETKDIKISISKWRELLGDKFPPDQDGDEDSDREPDSKGPFVIKSQTGDLTPRKFGQGERKR